MKIFLLADIKNYLRLKTTRAVMVNLHSHQTMVILLRDLCKLFFLSMNALLQNS